MSALIVVTLQKTDSCSWLPVKRLRVWVLIVLCLLLPVRGIMAAAMVCPPTGGTSSQHASDHQAGHDHGDQVHGQAEHSDHGEKTADHSHASGPDKCNMCSASCSTPPVPSAAAGLGTPVELSAAGFPDLFAPAPTFQSGGQDRPPRTI